MLELSILKSKFTGPSKVIKTEMVNCRGLGYIPSPNKFLILTREKFLNISPGEIYAFSVEENVALWNITGEIENIEIDPRGVLFCPQSNSILVCDGENSRVLVLNPRDGSHLQTISLSDMGEICEMGLYGDQIILLHRRNHQYKISYFSLK